MDVNADDRRGLNMVVMTCLLVLIVRATSLQAFKHIVVLAQCG